MRSSHFIPHLSSKPRADETLYSRKTITGGINHLADAGSLARLCRGCLLALYLGQASINQLFKDSANQANDVDDFVEVKILDAAVTPVIYSSWTIRLCERDDEGKKMMLMVVVPALVLPVLTVQPHPGWC